MIKAHKIRLHPTPEQASYFTRAAGTARFVFNWALAEWKRQYDAGEHPTALALKKQFNAIRREQFLWSYEVTKCAIEGAFMDVSAAFKNYFKGHTDLIRNWPDVQKVVRIGRKRRASWLGCIIALSVCAMIFCIS